MVVLELYSTCIRYRYKYYLFSKATIFIAIITLINITVPFFIAYNSRGFWLKHDTIYEQPDVKFRGEYLFIGYTNNISHKIICNNFAYYDDNFQDDCAEIKVREIDNNVDGKIDELHFDLKLSDLPKEMHIVRFNLLLTIDYTLHGTCRLHMQSAVIIQEFVNNFISQLGIASVLQLSQSSPIFCHPKIRNTQFNRSVIRNDANIDDYKFNNILDDFSKRNVTTYLSSIYRTFGIANEGFELNLKIKYPDHRVYYQPRFWHVIKWAWMQYFSIFIVFWWFLNKIKKFVFDNRLVVFHTEKPKLIKLKED